MTLDRRMLVKLAGGATAATLAPAPSIALAQATPVGQAGELIIGKGQEALSLDPAVATAAASHDLIAVAYERLVAFDEAGQPQPALAESWEIPDDLTYTFTLRQGVTFHNGKALTAEDVEYTIARIKAETTASPWADQFASVDEIEVVDSRTVTFRLSAPCGPFLATLSSGYASIVPADDAIDLQETMVGTGPFALDRRKPDVEMVMVANTAYWKEGEPLLTTVRWRILPGVSARLDAIRARGIHLTALADPLTVVEAQQTEGVHVLAQDTTDYYLLGLNCAEAPFDDPKVRQALSLAIDRQAIVDTALSGYGQVTGPIVPTMDDWAQPVEQLPTYTVDLEEARALLEEAGASDLSFTILVGSLYREFAGIAEAIRDQLATIGVTVELELVEWNTFLDRLFARDFQGFVSYNGSGNDPDSALYPAFHTEGSVNAFQFSDDEIDRLLESGRTMTDPEARRSVYQILEVALAEEAPAIFIATRVGFFAVRDTVSGFQPTAVQTWATLAQTTVTPEG
jgi:peptide/nickel transport system substrate-binding protein